MGACCEAPIFHAKIIDRIVKVRSTEQSVGIIRAGDPPTMKHGGVL